MSKIDERDGERVCVESMSVLRIRIDPYNFRSRIRIKV
jgi:hypothetical protein